MYNIACDPKVDTATLDVSNTRGCLLSPALATHRAASSSAQPLTTLLLHHGRAPIAPLPRACSEATTAHQPERHERLHMDDELVLQGCLRHAGQARAARLDGCHTLLARAPTTRGQLD